MATETVKPATDFVELVATMGHPIMDIPSERLRKLVAMTFMTEFMSDNSVTYESVRDDILGIMTENVGDIQKQIEAAREAKEKKVSTDLYDALRPHIMDIATKVPVEDRPKTFTILFDYNSAQKNPDGTPKMDAENNPVYVPDFEFKVFYREQKKGSTGGTRTGNYAGRVAGSYTFPDSKEADGSLKLWGSMKKYAVEKGYKDSDGLPREFLSKWYEIPSRPNSTDKDGEPVFAATMKAAA